MKDPLGIMATETIFVMEYYHSNVVEEFENMDMFKAGVTRKTRHCLTSGTELEQWYMGHTSTTTGNLSLSYQRLLHFLIPPFTIFMSFNGRAN